MTAFKTSYGLHYGSLVLASAFVVAALLMPTPNSQAEAVDISLYQVPSNTINYDCILERSASHVPLHKAEQLPTYDNKAEIDFRALDLSAVALEDAYFRGTLTLSLSNLQAQIPESKGQYRDTAFAKIREARLIAAKTAAGKCLPERSFVDQYQFHKTGLAKPHVMKMISAAYYKASQSAPQDIRR